MKTYLLKAIACLSCFFYFVSGYAQSFPGFSKIYRSDLIASSYNAAHINVLFYDSTQQALYFSMKVMVVSQGEKSYTKFYKSSLDGTTQVTRYDTQAVFNMNYTAAATDGQYIYWAGSKVHPYTSSQSRLKILKTNMNLDKVWEKEYRARPNKKQGILIIDKGHLLVTSADNFGTALYKIDSAGSVLYRDTVFSSGFTRGLALKDDQGYLLSDQFRVSAIDSNMQLVGSVPRSHYSGGSTIAKSKEEDGALYICGGVYSDVPEMIDGGYMNGAVQKISINGPTSRANIYTQFTCLSSVYSLFEDGYQSISSAVHNGCAAVGRAAQANTTFSEINRIDTGLHSIWNYGYTHVTGKPSALSQIISLPDGGFVASGWAEAPNPNGSSERQGWLLRVDSNGCFDSTCTGMILPEPSGITDPGKTQFSIAPNPAENVLEIRLQEAFLSDASVYITDALGRSVQTIIIPAGKLRLNIDVQAWANGVYLINLQNRKSRFHQKLIIRH